MLVFLNSFIFQVLKFSKTRSFSIFNFQMFQNMFQKGFKNVSQMFNDLKFLKFPKIKSV